MTDLDYEEDLGELVDVGDIESPASTDESIILDTHSPTFIGHDNTRGALLDKSKCRLCSKRVPAALTIDGMCIPCAKKRMRFIEETLVRFKQLKEPHTWCCVEGHGLAAKNPKGLEDWNGHININGIDLYPVVPVCQHCVNLTTTQLVAYLEERGWLRKGSDHTDNAYGTPYKTKLSIADREEAIIRLRDYIAALEVLVNSKDGQLIDLHKSILSTRGVLQKKHLLELKKHASETSQEPHRDDKDKT